MIKVLLLAIGIVSVAIALMAVKMFFIPDAHFTGGSCSAKSSPELKAKGISCNCSTGRSKCENDNTINETKVSVKNIKV